MELKNNQYLVPGFDHSYEIREADESVVNEMECITVVYNIKVNMFFEYLGDEYLEDGDIYVDAPILD